MTFTSIEPSVRRIDKVRHSHCCHLLAFFVWRVRAELDLFGDLLEVTFFGSPLESVLVKSPEDSSSAGAVCFVSWATLRFTALRFLMTSAFESFDFPFALAPFRTRLSLAPGLWPRLRRFVASSLLASAERASYSQICPRSESSLTLMSV